MSLETFDVCLFLSNIFFYKYQELINISILTRSYTYPATQLILACTKFSKFDKSSQAGRFSLAGRIRPAGGP